MRVRLLERLERATQVAVSSDALALLHVIQTCGGRVTVEELARQVHLSPRHLRRVMGRALGIGPTFASRVARLATGVGRAGDGADSWAQVAAESGYHDQSHLVRDFNVFMGTTPSAWLAEEAVDRLEIERVVREVAAGLFVELLSALLPCVRQSNDVLSVATD